MEEAQEAAEYNLDPGDIKADDLDITEFMKPYRTKNSLGSASPVTGLDSEMILLFKGLYGFYLYPG